MIATKIGSKTKTYVSIALIAFIISGLSLAAGLFYNNNYPKSKCKNAFKIIQSSNCQGANKKYTVVSFCSKNKQVQKLAIKKLKKSKNCYKSYKILKKKACKSYYDKTINLYCPIQPENNNKEEKDQEIKEPDTETNTDIPKTNNNTPANITPNPINDPIEDEFHIIERQQPVEQIKQFTNDLDSPTYTSKWSRKNDLPLIDPSNPRVEVVQSIVVANLDNSGSKEIINQAFLDGFSTIKLYVRDTSGNPFNNNWPLEITNCKNNSGNPISCVPNQTFVATNYRLVKNDRVTNWATPITIGLANDIVTSFLKAGPVGFFFHDLYSFNKNGQNNLNWPISKERPNTNLIASNLENNQNTNILFGSNNNTFILNNQGSDIFNNLFDKKSSVLAVDNSSPANPKIISLGFDYNSPSLQIYNTAGENLPNYPKELPELKNYSSNISLTLSDLNNDRSKDIIITGDHSQGGLYLNALQYNGNSLPGFPKKIALNSVEGSNLKISSADINKDNRKEIILAYNNNDNNILIKIINNDGSELLTTQLTGTKHSEPLLANLSDDNKLEIIIAIDNSIYILDPFIFAYKKIDMAGNDLNNSFYSPTVLLDDLNNNKKIDLISNIGNKLSVWELNFPITTPPDMPWPMPDQNNQRTRIAP